MKNWLLDIPVFLTFFVRHQTLEKVFDVIREVRPRVLFLVGDGPRKGRDDDIRNNEKCKKIIENINWECKVYRYYAKTNRGITINSYEGKKRAFQIVDRLIFLEDDMIPSKSFFYFCTELLEKYKDDTRIQSICGMNLEEIYNKPNSDFFFSKSNSSGACAYWRRTFEKLFDNNYLEDRYILKTLEDNLPNNRKSSLIMKAKRERLEQIKNGKLLTGELAMVMNQCLLNQVNIIPTKNMVVSIGVMPDSAHTAEDIRMLPKAVRKLFELNIYEYEFPLKYPNYMIRDINYEKLCRRKLGLGHPFVRLYRMTISFFLIARYGGIQKAIKLLICKLERIFYIKGDINA